MIEIMFVLTTIFVAYVVHAIANEQHSATKAKPSDNVQPTVQPVQVEQTPKAQIKPIPLEIMPIKSIKPSVKKPSVAKAPVTKSPVATNVKTGLRDPKTGEVATVANNYRFMKRWIKEALVAEGLVEKIYKNNELDAVTETLIKQALTKLEGMEKYQVLSE